MSAGERYAELMDQISATDVLAELDEIAGVYTQQATTLEEALGQITVIQENLAAEHSRGTQALSYIEAASSTMHSSDVLEPAHTDMATATGELAAARHEVNQSQERVAQAMDMTEQQKEPVSRSQQECTTHAADLRNALEKLQMLGSLAADAKALANPDAQ
jgi:hypothetical protein